MSALLRSPAGVSRGAIVLAAGVPFLFVHTRYTLGATVTAGGVDVSIRLSDVAIAAIVVAAAATWRRDGPGPLAGARALWPALAVLVAIVVGSVAWGAAATDGYPTGTNLVSALKFAEYALLAPATALLLRTRRDFELLAATLTVWTVAAAVVALLQFVGLLGDLDNTPAGRRKPSFLGYHDFAALTGATLLLGVALLALGRRRAWVPATAGAVGLALAGSVAAAAGVAAGTVVLLALVRRSHVVEARNALAAVVVVVVALGGTAAIRSGDVGDFARFLGLAREERDEAIETYSHRTVLAYIGLRIAADHPVLGTGWQGSALPASFEPYIDDARARFPSVSELSLPSRAHPWGVQNAYVQAAADMGLIGLLALLAVICLAAAAAYRRAAALAAAVALAWILVAAAELAALGLVAGVPVWALLWLATGTAVASSVVREEAP